MLRIAYHTDYLLPLPPGHRFPMQKYELIPEQLLYEGTVTPDVFHAPGLAADSDILAVHHADYLHRLRTLALTPAEIRRTGFPLTQHLVQRELMIAQGTIDTALHALQHGCGLNVAGGTHHAYPGHGEGFCLLNDQAVAAAYLLRNGLAQRILMLDLDVHQGNGTACIFAHTPQVFTFSMHGAANYPHKKEQSDWDIALPTGTQDAEYLDILRQALPQLLDRHRPDFVFYLSGVDVLEVDRLGKLALTRDGCRERDRTVFEWLQAAGLPVQVSMGGGYAPRLADIVEAHCNTYRLAQHYYG